MRPLLNHDLSGSFDRPPANRRMKTVDCCLAADRARHSGLDHSTAPGRAAATCSFGRSMTAQPLRCRVIVRSRAECRPIDRPCRSLVFGRIIVQYSVAYPVRCLKRAESAKSARRMAQRCCVWGEARQHAFRRRYQIAAACRDRQGAARSWSVRIQAVVRSSSAIAERPRSRQYGRLLSMPGSNEAGRPGLDKTCRRPIPSR